MRRTGKMLDVNLKTSIVTGTIFSMSEKIANVVMKTLLAPFVIASMGLGGFGVWNLLMSVTNYPRFGVGGIQAAFQQYVSASTATGDYEKASRLLTTGSVMILVVTTVVSLPFLILTEVTVGFFNVPTEYLGEFSAALRLLIVVVIISNTSIAYSAIIAGAHRLEVIKKVGMVWLIVESVFTVVLLLIGYRLSALAVPYAVGQIGRLVTSIYLARRILPWITLHPKFASLRVAKSLVGFAGSFHLLGMLEMLYLTLVPVLVMRYCGAVISGVYAAGTRLTTFSSFGAESILLPLLSSSTYVVAKGDQSRSKVLFKYSLIFVVFTGLPLMLFVWLFGDQILFAWTGERHEQFMISMFLLAAIGMCSLIARHHMIIYRSRGEKFHDFVWMTIRFGGVCTVGLVLVREVGFTGLLFGQLIGEVFGLIFMMYVMWRFVETDYVSVMKDSYVVVSVSAVAASILWYFSLVIFENLQGRIATLGVLGLWFTVYMSLVGVCAWLGLGEKEKHELRSLIPSEKLVTYLRL